MSVLEARQTFIQSLKTRADVGISSDNVGLNGNTAHAIHTIKKVCERLGVPPQSIGLEMIAWRYQPTPYNTKSPVNIVGYHSRLGTSWSIRIDTVVTAMSDLCIRPHDKIFKALKNSTFPTYVIVHQLAAIKILEKPLHTLRPDKFLAIENATEKNSCQNTLDQTKNREGVIPVFDIVHYLREQGTLYHTTKEDWAKMCEALTTYEHCIVHLPIGQQQYDSLHLEHITEEMWHQLAVTLKKNNTFITLEYQPKNMLKTNLSRNQKEIARIVKIIQLLQSYGVLQLHTTS